MSSRYPKRNVGSRMRLMELDTALIAVAEPTELLDGPVQRFGPKEPRGCQGVHEVGPGDLAG